MKTTRSKRRTNAQIGSAIRRAVMAAGGKRNEAERIVGNQSLLVELAAVILPVAVKAGQVKELVITSITHAFSFMVDTTQSFADSVKAGHYNWVNPDITAEHFPFQSKGRGNVKIEIWWPNKHFKDGDEVITELDKLNQELAGKGANYRYRFAYLEELLALGANQPELQRSFPIAVLGSIWLDSGLGRRFAYLGGVGAGRDLYLGGVGYGFFDFWRFTLVREPARNA